MPTHNPAPARPMPWRINICLTLAADAPSAMRIELDASAQNVRIAAKLPLPQLFANDRHFGTIGRVVRGGKNAAEQGSDAESAEHGAGQFDSKNGFGRAVPVHDSHTPAVNAEVLKKLRARGHINGVGKGNIALFVAIFEAVFLNRHEALRLCVGQGTQQQPIGQAEYERSGTDAQSEYGDSRNGDGGVLAHDANGV